jgi:prepilin-type N-terminal cleavage/methylation domain-containing protein
MKLNNYRYAKSRSGMTLLEMTVVILVLLSLTSILFIGAKAWKKGADRSANIMNLRNVQLAVRGHASTNDITQAETGPPVVVGGAIPRAAIFGAADDGVNGYLRFPATIQSVTYTTPNQINTATGVLYLVASATGAPVAANGTQTEYGPKPGSTVDW